MVFLFIFLPTSLDYIKKFAELNFSVAVLIDLFDESYNFRPVLDQTHGDKRFFQFFNPDGVRFVLA